MQYTWACNILPVVMSRVFKRGFEIIARLMLVSTLDGILDAAWLRWVCRLVAVISMPRKMPVIHRRLSSLSWGLMYTNSTGQSPDLTSFTWGWEGQGWHSRVEAMYKQSSTCLGHSLTQAHGTIQQHIASSTPSTSMVTICGLRIFPFPSWMSVKRKCALVLSWCGLAEMSSHNPRRCG